MINIQERALRALEEDVVAPAQGLLEQDDGIGNEWLEEVAGGAIGLVDLLERKRPCAEGLEHFVVLFDLERELFFEALGLDQVNYSQAGARRFVAVGGADAAFGGADFIFSFEDFPLGVEFAMIGEDQVRGFF